MPDPEPIKPPAPAKKPAVDSKELFINRELSSLEFNRRVLEEAEDERHPLLERVKFLAICGSNLDEFFMSRVSDLRRQMVRGVSKPSADGLPPAEALDKVRVQLLPLLFAHGRCWYEDLQPLLKKNGIRVFKWNELSEEQQSAARALFYRDIYPALTPLAFDATHPFPSISNLSTNLAVTVRDHQQKDRYARVKVPVGIYERFIRLPQKGPAEERASESKVLDFILLEDLISANIDLLFPGAEVASSYPFRVTRDAEIEIQLEDASDLLSAVEEGVENRRVGLPVRLEVGWDTPPHMVDLLAKKLDLPKYLVFQSHAPLALADLWQMLAFDRPALKDRPFNPYVPGDLADPIHIFTAIRRKDFVLFHPYDSFAPVVGLLQQAAEDPDVLAIKITLYRIDKRSPIVDALIKARKHGKQVAAVVELKAKFDEENNINYARTLEQEGVHVVYGPVDLKVHAKMCLVVRREKGGITKYTHLSSGNYNNVTTRTYGDLGYLTANEDLGADVSDLFNALTGYSEMHKYRKLLVAPRDLRSGVIQRIDREIQKHAESGSGYLAFKLNGLLDKEVVKALYRASQAGIKVDLNIRGLCSLRPGVKNVSDNIRVTSIVSRFLEHSRIYYFRNGGEEEVLLGSSDLMPRNLDRRVEILFPVIDEKIKRAIIKYILATHLKDNLKARILKKDGSYKKLRPAEGEEAMDSQKWFLEHRGIWHEEGP